MIASTIATEVAKRQQVKGQKRAMRTAAEVRANEIQDKYSAQAGERVKQARAEEATLRVAAGEAGVAGQSFEAQLMDVDFQADSDLARINLNAANEQKGANASNASQFASIPQSGNLATGLQIIGAGVSAYSSAKAAEVE